MSLTLPILFGDDRETWQMILKKRNGCCCVSFSMASGSAMAGETETLASRIVPIVLHRGCLLFWGIGATIIGTEQVYWPTRESTQPTGIILVLVQHTPLIMQFVVMSCFVVLSRGSRVGRYQDGQRKRLRLFPNSMFCRETAALV